MELNRQQRRAGYRRARKVFRLHWDEGEFQGLEIEMTGASMETMIELSELGDLAAGGAFSPKDVQRLMPLFDQFGECIIGWNLETEEGEPVETSAKGLLAQDPPLVMAVIMQWIEAVAGVPRPLEPTSSVGDPSQEVNIPMAAPSASPPNYAALS